MSEHLSIAELPLAKRKDPWTSDLAGESFHRSGRMDSQRQQVLRALRLYGPCTSAELAVAMECDRYGPHRRLSELERLGLAQRDGFRQCRITKQKCVVWESTKVEHDLFGNPIKKGIIK